MLKRAALLLVVGACSDPLQPLEKARADAQANLRLLDLVDVDKAIVAQLPLTEPSIRVALGYDSFAIDNAEWVAAWPRDILLRTVAQTPNIDMLRADIFRRIERETWDIPYLNDQIEKMTLRANPRRNVLQTWAGHPARRDDLLSVPVTLFIDVSARFGDIERVLRSAKRPVVHAALRAGEDTVGFPLTFSAERFYVPGCRRLVIRLSASEAELLRREDGAATFESVLRSADVQAVLSALPRPHALCRRMELSIAEDVSWRVVAMVAQSVWRSGFDDAVFVTTRQPVRTEPVSLALSAHFAVRMERSECYGTCPVYSVDIDDRRDVTFQCSAFCKDNDAHSRRLSNGEVVDLVAAARRLAHAGLAPRYVAVSTDGPTTRLLLTIEGQQRSTSNPSEALEDAPDLSLFLLREFEQLVDILAESKQWIGP